MKTILKKISITFVLVITLFCADLCVYAAEIPGIQTPYYGVMDACSGSILFSSNGDDPIYPASSVKLVTAMVVLDTVPLDKTVTITKEMLSHVPADAYQIHLRSGGEYSVYELLQMLLISSAADAAQALAEGCFQDYNECVSKMNEKALSLGLVQTHFDNVIGLDIGNGCKQTYTTANEFLMLCRLAMSYDVIRQIVSTPVYAIPARKNNAGIQRRSTNRFYSTASYSTNLYTIIGSKTGTTRNAGNVLITTATNGTHEIICASFKNSTRPMAYTETRKILDYTFTLSNSGDLALESADYHNWYEPVVVQSELEPGAELESGVEPGAEFEAKAS